MADLRERLKQFIRDELARDFGDIDVETEPLVESGIIDSLGIMKLVQFVEKEFDIRIGDDELLPENFETLDDITKMLESKRG